MGNELWHLTLWYELVGEGEVTNSSSLEKSLSLYLQYSTVLGLTGRIPG